MAPRGRAMALALFSFIFLQVFPPSLQRDPALQSSTDPSSRDTAADNAVSGEGRVGSYGDVDGSVLMVETLQERRPHSPPPSRRKLLQSAGIMPYTPLTVAFNGKTCILFRARKLAVRYRNHTLVDLTERAFGPEALVDTKGSFCSKDKATLNLRFGDVDDLRSLSVRLQMSNTFYESAGQNWFTLDSVHIHYNWTHEATFNATDVYAPSTNSYHCQHISSLQKYDTLLVPSSNTDNSANWHITFTDFQIQAFNVQSSKFASASDCATFFTPAILMGLITSLILLLVLAYALHMVVHLKHIDRYEEHKTTVYFPRNTEAECTEKNNL
ncbi:ATPase H+ transporting accessory protein 1 like a [Hoplias malabaricus]|uniref:ATPase H+ transporting accessory protein 1 like a n=1 Tax=Hoplias malabaricus TaxID=27720 RepID=UPI003462C94F